MSLLEMWVRMVTERKDRGDLEKDIREPLFPAGKTMNVSVILLTRISFNKAHTCT